MVLLELLVPQRQILVVQEVVCQVVADVSEDTATKDGGADIPVRGKNKVCKLPEWVCKNHEKGRGHHQSVFVHGQVVVNAMEQKVCSDTDTVIRKPSMHC